MADHAGRPPREFRGYCLRISGRVALVTGGAVRVGRALALALAAEGAKVAVHYNASRGDAEETLAEIEKHGGEGLLFQSDLSGPDAPAHLVRDVASSLGGLDIVVNSAAMMQRTPIGEVTTEDWDAMFSLNLRAPFFICQAAAAAMGEKGGVIVNIADLAAFESWPAYVPHGITKAGIVQMTRSLARALAPKIRVNAIAPGAVLLPEGWSAEGTSHLEDTTPLGRLGSPTDVAGAMLYLIDAEYVTGTTLVVDGGRHIRK